MRLHEYQAKSLFARYDIPILTGEVVTTPDGVRVAVERLQPPVIINAQVLANERVFRAASTIEEAVRIASEMLGTKIGGYAVNRLLIEPQLSIKQEFGLSIEFDRSRGQVVISATSLQRKQSGFSIIDPLMGIHTYQARYLASIIELPSTFWDEFVTIARNLYRCYMESDATRAAILPLGLSSAGKLLALGGKIDVDDNALSRQPELAGLRDMLAEDELPSREVHDRVRVMRMGGAIACIANGAGLAMATADALAQFDGALAPGVVIEIDGEVTPERLQAALRHVPKDTRGVIINLFCARFSAINAADYLHRVLTLAHPDCPVVIRLAGKDVEEAQQRLLAAPTVISTVNRLTQAVELLSHALTGGLTWRS